MRAFHERARCARVASLARVNLADRVSRWNTQWRNISDRPRKNTKREKNMRKKRRRESLKQYTTKLKQIYRQDLYEIMKFNRMMLAAMVFHVFFLRVAMC